MMARIVVDGRQRSLAWLSENSAAATIVRVYNCAGLGALELPAATYIGVENCPGLGTLELPAATDVRVYNCAGLAHYAGDDSRGYQFVAVRARGQYMIVAGCRNLSVAQAHAHWGPGGPSDRPDCLALVERLAAEIGEAA